jgi:hypothetical protein
MSKIVKVQGGDYRIVVGSLQTPGTIILDTNPSSNRNLPQGDVIVTGDLTVRGKTTIVQSETLSIRDNIIELNVGEEGEGVSTQGSESGIQIHRGSLSDAFLVWDEQLKVNPAIPSLIEPGFKFVDASDDLVPIATNRIFTKGQNLSLITSGSGVVTVTGTSDYEWQVLDQNRLNTVFDIVEIGRNNNIATITVNGTHGLIPGNRVDIDCTSNSTFSGRFLIVLSTPSSDSFTYENAGINISPFNPAGTVKPNSIIDDDIIPNIRAVAELTYNVLESFSSNKISEADTKVQTYDSDVSGGTSKITFEVNGNEVAVVGDGTFSAGNIRVSGNSLSNYSNNDVLFDSVLSLANRSQTLPPPSQNGYVKLYSKSTTGTGGTGLYFVTKSSPTSTTVINDELISKTKALLFSLIL